MATCGFCKAKNLKKVSSNNDGKGLETHTIPNTRKQCEGMSTAPGYNHRVRNR